MLELILFAVVIGCIAKIATLMNKSAFVWGGITLLICFGALFIPLPFMRALIAGGAAFVALFVAEMVRPTQS